MGTSGEGTIDTGNDLVQELMIPTPARVKLMGLNAAVAAAAA